MECKETKKFRNPSLRPSCGFLRIKIENGKVQKTKPLFFVGNKVFVFLSLQVKHIKQTVPVFGEVIKERIYYEQNRK
jgi:hypothetical protein